MSVQVPISAYPLHPGALLAVRKGGRGVIRCLRGKVLVSLAGCARDFTLEPGMTLALDNNPLVLIESIEPACIDVTSGKPAQRPFGAWLGLGLLSGLGLLWVGGGGVDVSSQSTRAQIGSAPCDRADRAARAQGWRAGKDMLGPGGLPATNRLIASYESGCHGKP